jgi:preprotein translocase subunit SecY
MNKLLAIVLIVLSGIIFVCLMNYQREVSGITKVIINIIAGVACFTGGMILIKVFKKKT